jgi:hypothetical protein
MTTSAAPSLRRLTPQAAILLLVAAVAWLVTVDRAGAMAGIALAVAVFWVPALAPGLHETSQMMSMAGS